MRLSLTPEEQRIVAEGVKQGNRRSTEKLLTAFKPLIMSFTGRLLKLDSNLSAVQAAHEVTCALIELTLDWDPARRHLDGYLKQYLGYWLMEQVKQLRRDEGKRVWHRREERDRSDEDEVIVVQTGKLEEMVPESHQEATPADTLGEMVVAQIITECRTVLTERDDWLLFQLKMQKLESPEIGQILGVSAAKVRRDMDRRVRPRIRPVFAKYGLAVD